MHHIGKLIGAIFATIAGIVSGLQAASAQDAPFLDGYQFLVTPYLWLASVHATTLTPLAREPQVNSNVSTIDLLSHLDGAPFMGSFEVRYGSLGFLADAIHLPVSTKITTHDIFYNGGNAGLKADTGTGIALYRLLEDPVQFAATAGPPALRSMSARRPSSIATACSTRGSRTVTKSARRRSGRRSPHCRAVQSIRTSTARPILSLAALTIGHSTAAPASTTKSL
jgi:hypothetical protein